MRMHGLALLGLVAMVGCGGGGGEEATCSPAKEITTSAISRSGDTWKVNITSKFDQPVDAVFAAFQAPEKAHDLLPDNVLKSELIKGEGNVKLVDVVGKLDILPPGFKVQNIRTEYTYHPQEKRITSKSIEFKLADITSEYKFAAAPDGKGTVLTFTQQSKDKAPMIVESLQRGALCETYVRQVQVAQKVLAGGAS